MFHSKQWHYSLPQRLPETAFYTKKSKGFFKFYILLGYPSRTPYSMQKTESSSSSPEIKFYIQKAKRSLSTSFHPTRPSKGIPGIPAARPSKGIPDIPDIPVIHDIQPPKAILHVPVPPGFPPFYSILQLECIFYTSTGFHRNSTEYQLRHYKHYYKLSFFKEREML